VEALRRDDSVEPISKSTPLVAALREPSKLAAVIDGRYMPSADLCAPVFIPKKFNGAVPAAAVQEILRPHENLNGSMARQLDPLKTAGLPIFRRGRSHKARPRSHAF